MRSEARQQRLHSCTHFQQKWPARYGPELRLTLLGQIKSLTNPVACLVNLMSLGTMQINIEIIVVLPAVQVLL